MTDKPTPTDAELFALIKEHFGLDQRRDDTVINRGTGRFHDAQRYRDFAAAVLALAKWGQPAVAAEPVAWAATSEDGVVEALGMNQSRRFDTPLYLTPQPVAREPLTEVQINAAGKKMAECMDYPWGHMPEQGRAEMRKHAQAVIEAAHGIKGGQP